MSLPVRATALLVLIAGCGGQHQQAKQTALPQTPPRTATATSPTTGSTHTATSEAEPSPAAQTQTQTSEAEAPPTTQTQPAPATPPPSDGPWTDCGRIRSPVDRRPQHVEAKVFDCRAARRVAVRYLRNGALPRGWTPTDCAASRAACEQGGWGFRVVQK